MTCGILRKNTVSRSLTLGVSEVCIVLILISLRSSFYPHFSNILLVLSFIQCILNIHNNYEGYFKVF